MKNKGFTLIELICTILLLSLIITLSTVAVINVINNARERENASSMKLIEAATKDYFTKYENDYYIANGVNYCIDIQELIDENLLISKISYDGEDIKNKTIKVEYNNNTYNVAFEEKNNCLLNETKEYTITNLIPDGSFENKSWTGCVFDETYSKYGNFSCKLVGIENERETFAYAENRIYLDNTHKYYGAFRAYQTEKNGYSLDFYWPILEPVFFRNINIKDAGSWQIYSAVKTRETFTSGNYTLRLDYDHFDDDKTNAVVYLDGVILIDLTQSFGEGNEPTVEWCDQHIDFFNGTTTVYK